MDGSCWWMQLFRIMREHSNTDLIHYRYIYSFIVIIVCFFSYKLLIRSHLIWYMFEGLLFHSEVFSLCFFDMKLSFFLVVGRGSVEVISDMLTYFIVHFSSEKIDWSWIKQSAASQTRFLKNKCVFKQSICPWQCQ